MAEGFDLYGTARGTGDAVPSNRLGDRADLFEREFACRNEDVGELRVKAKRLDVRDVELRLEVRFEPDCSGVCEGGGV